jgi:predicted P-loop ATPase/GTPase
MSISRKNAHKVSAEASKLGAKVLGGRLTKMQGRYFINQTDVTELLDSLLDKNVVFVAGAVEAYSPDKEEKTCLTCGHDYKGKECPRCARARARLRR